MKLGSDSPVASVNAYPQGQHRRHHHEEHDAGPERHEEPPGRPLPRPPDRTRAPDREPAHGVATRRPAASKTSRRVTRRRRWSPTACGARGPRRTASARPRRRRRRPRPARSSRCPAARRPRRPRRSGPRGSGTRSSGRTPTVVPSRPAEQPATGCRGQRRAAEEPRDRERRRRLVELGRRADLRQPSVQQHGHAVAQGQRLGLVVGDVHGRAAEAAVDRDDLRASGRAQLCVEARQRLVEQPHRRPPQHGPGRAPPAGAARTTAGRGTCPPALPGPAPRRRRQGAPPAPRAARAAAAARTPGSARRRGAGRARGLEHHGDVALLRRDGRDVAPPDPDDAGGRLVKAGQHPQRGGLAGSGRPDQRQQLAVGRLERQLVERDDVAEATRHALPADQGSADREERLGVARPAGRCRPRGRSGRRRCRSGCCPPRTASRPRSRSRAAVALTPAPR